MIEKKKKKITVHVKLTVLHSLLLHYSQFSAGGWVQSVLAVVCSAIWQR